VAGKKIHFKSISSLDVTYLGPTSLELVEHRSFECVPCIGSTASVKRTYKSRVGRINLARIAISLALRVGCHRNSDEKKGIYEMP